jgi:hypothetical protein
MSFWGFRKSINIFVKKIFLILLFSQCLCSTEMTAIILLLQRLLSNRELFFVGKKSSRMLILKTHLLSIHLQIVLRRLLPPPLHHLLPILPHYILVPLLLLLRRLRLCSNLREKTFIEFTHSRTILFYLTVLK